MLLHTIAGPLLSLFFGHLFSVLVNLGEDVRQRECRQSEEGRSGEIETRCRVRARRGCGGGHGVGVGVGGIGSGDADGVHCPVGDDGERGKRDSLSVEASRPALKNSKFSVLRNCSGAILGSTMDQIFGGYAQCKRGHSKFHISNSASHIVSKDFQS